MCGGDSNPRRSLGHLRLWRPHPRICRLPTAFEILPQLVIRVRAVGLKPTRSLSPLGQNSPKRSSIHKRRIYLFRHARKRGNLDRELRRNFKTIFHFFSLNNQNANARLLHHHHQHHHGVSREVAGRNLALDHCQYTGSNLCEAHRTRGKRPCKPQNVRYPITRSPITTAF